MMGGGTPQYTVLEVLRRPFGDIRVSAYSKLSGNFLRELQSASAIPLPAQWPSSVQKDSYVAVASKSDLFIWVPLPQIFLEFGHVRCVNVLCKRILLTISVQMFKFTDSGMAKAIVSSAAG
jgi:hypothetical protein